MVPTLRWFHRSTLATGWRPRAIRRATVSSRGCGQGRRPRAGEIRSSRTCPRVLLCCRNRLFGSWPFRSIASARCLDGFAHAIRAGASPMHADCTRKGRKPMRRVNGRLPVGLRWPSREDRSTLRKDRRVHAILVMRMAPRRPPTPAPRRLTTARPALEAPNEHRWKALRIALPPRRFHEPVAMAISAKRTHARST